MLKRKIFRLINKAINPTGLLLSKPEIIHGSPAFSGATTFSRKLQQFRYFYDKINNVDGCVIESGVHWGYGILAHLFFTGERGYPQRDIYGFDSFEGHSKPNEKDLSGGNFKNLGSHFKISQEDVWKTLTLGTEYNQSQYLGEKVHLIPGWIQETMPTFKRELKMDSISD